MAPPHDLAVTNASVIDPKPGFDAFRNAGLTASAITAAGTAQINANVSVDIAGCVLCPGLIDLHSHAQTITGLPLQALDGVTTAVEPESCALPVRTTYDGAADEGRTINFGCPASWAPASMFPFDDTRSVGEELSAFCANLELTGRRGPLTASQRHTLMSLPESEVEDGEVGIGVLTGHAPATGTTEYLELASPDRAFQVDDTIIASDSIPVTIGGTILSDNVWPVPVGARTHPRSAGCVARAIGHPVQERHVLPLAEAIRRSTLLPAQTLASATPAMACKGQIQDGADADIVIFDPLEMTDRATSTHVRPSRGIPHVLGYGTFVVRDRHLVTDAVRGRPIVGHPASCLGMTVEG